jgi:hypothetical protein
MRDLLCKEVYPHFFAKVMRDLLQADGNSIASYTVYCTVCTVKKHEGNFPHELHLWKGSDAMQRLVFGQAL